MDWLRKYWMALLVASAAVIAGVGWWKIEPLLVQPIEVLKPHCLKPAAEKQNQASNYRGTAYDAINDVEISIDVVKTDKPAEHGGANHPNVEHDCLVAQYTYDLARITAWLVLFTGFLGFGTVVTAFIAKGAAEQAERTSRIVEGAWIFAQPAPINGTKQTWKILVKNHGKTPGLITGYHLEFWECPPNERKPRYNGPIDGAKTRWPCSPLDSLWPLPYEFVRDANKKFAVGFVQYLDAFNKTKTSRFCYDVSDPTVIRLAGSPAYNSFHPEEGEG